MKKFLILIALGTIQPIAIFAQDWNVPQSGDSFAYASLFTGNLSLLLSIVIGIIAIIFIFRSAKKFGGGLFESVLNYIGIGILMIVLGTIAATVNPFFTGFWFGMVSTICFAAGYIFTVIGANKLFRGIMNT